MGRWKWLNLAVVAAAGWYGYLDVVTDWNPYQPAFHPIGAVTFSGCSAVFQSGTHRGRMSYQLRFDATSCWMEVRRAWLVAGAERVPFSGSRHRYRTTLTGTEQHLPLMVEIERWDSTRESATVSPKEKTR
jgi:hypothetical protein